MTFFYRQKWYIVAFILTNDKQNTVVYTCTIFVVSRAFMAGAASQAGDADSPGHLVSLLVCRGPWMSTVVLYCWCYSDSTSVLLYFTFYVQSCATTNNDISYFGLIKRGLRVGNLKVCHVIPKFDEINLLLKGPQTLDILGLCETFLDDQVNSNLCIS